MVCVTGDTLWCMKDVTIRELRHRGGDVVERARRGEDLTITRDGEPVARITALDPAPTPLTVLRERWARLPDVDPESLLADVDSAVDPTI